MYKHCDIDDEYISLHDCHATKVINENGVLAFVFRDGIWVTQGHPSNIADKTLCTDVAEVEFYLESGDESDITLYVFEEKSRNLITENVN